MAFNPNSLKGIVGKVQKLEKLSQRRKEAGGEKCACSTSVGPGLEPVTYRVLGLARLSQ